MAGDGSLAVVEDAVISLPVAYREQVRARGKRTAYLRRAVKHVGFDVRALARKADFRIEGGAAAGSYVLHEGRHYREVEGDLPIPEAYPIAERSHSVEIEEPVALDDDFDVAVEHTGAWVAANGLLVSGRLFAATEPPHLLVEIDPLGKRVRLTSGDAVVSPDRMVFPLTAEEGAWAFAIEAARLLSCEPEREAQVTFNVDPESLGLGDLSPEAQLSALAKRSREFGLNEDAAASGLLLLARLPL